MISKMFRHTEWLDKYLIQMISKHIKNFLARKVSYFMDTPVHSVKSEILLHFVDSQRRIKSCNRNNTNIIPQKCSET